MHDEDLGAKVLGVHRLFKRGVLTKMDCDAALDYMLTTLNFSSKSP